MPELEMPDISATLGDAFDAAQDLPDEQPDTSEAAPTEELAAEPIDDSTAPADEPDVPALEAEDTAPETAPQQAPTRSYDDIEQILAPRREAFAMDGMNDAQALHQLFALSDFANRDPEAFIRAFAQQRGVNLASEPAPVEEEIDEFADPLARQAMQELRTLKQEMAQQRQTQVDAQAQQSVSVVNQFAAARDEAGNPMHPHFAAVRHHMATLMQAGVNDLSQAYDQACWANPQVRAELMKGQEAERLAKAKVAAEKAARTAAQPRGEGGRFTTPQATTMTDTMSAVYDSLHS